MNYVYLNGEYLPREQATVSVMDRGFLFGDGIYEVIPCYNHKLFRFHQHIVRLKQSLAATRIQQKFSPEDWLEIINKLIEMNRLKHCSVYLQVTRGLIEERDHCFTRDNSASVFVMTRPLPASHEQPDESGLSLLAVDDIRWHRCDIKSTSLIANCLLKQQAQDQGADEVLLVRDGKAIEGGASNLFIVADGVIKTPPKNELILAGITRDLIVELAHNNNMPLVEDYFSLEDVYAADEVWISSSTRQLSPVWQVDSQLINDGKTGAVWYQIIEHYNEFKQKLYRGEVD